jgi:hypothetical protein
MAMNTLKQSFISTSVVLSLIALFALSPLSVARAITDEQITKQEESVKAQLIVTIEEQIKLLQMMLIQKLELQISELTAEQK